MELPSTIQITPKVRYEIVYLPTFPQNQRSQKSVFGECRFKQKQIVIALDQGQTELWGTLIHEILHAIEFEYKLEIPHKLIHKLEMPLLKLLVLNDWLGK